MLVTKHSRSRPERRLEPSIPGLSNAGVPPWRSGLVLRPRAPLQYLRAARGGLPMHAAEYRGWPTPRRPEVAAGSTPDGQLRQPEAPPLPLNSLFT